MAKASMQQRHFQAIADALYDWSVDQEVRGDGEQTPQEAYRDICDRVADKIAPFNGRFDRARFLEACGAQ